MGKIERIKCGDDNVYLVSGDKYAILVDTSREQYKDSILAKCKTKNVKLIILTHGHIDHIQNAAYLSKELGAPIAMHEADYVLTKNKLGEPLFAHSHIGKILLKIVQKIIDNNETDPFEPARFLKDGDSLNEYGVSATVVELPGHTKGSIGVIVGGTDIIVGDALMNILWPAKSPIYGNRIVMEESAAKISSLGDMMVHFGHGNPVKNKKW